MERFQLESKTLRKQFYDMTQSMDSVNDIVNKLTNSVIMYEYILAELKKNL